MKHSWLMAMAAVWALAGCGSSDGPPAAVEAGSSETPNPKPTACPLHDEFNLPLMIHIEAPEVPPEIQKPSPPIPEEPAAPSPGWFDFLREPERKDKREQPAK